MRGGKFITSLLFFVSIFLFNCGNQDKGEGMRRNMNGKQALISEGQSCQAKFIKFNSTGTNGEWRFFITKKEFLHNHQMQINKLPAPVTLCKFLKTSWQQHLSTPHSQKSLNSGNKNAIYTYFSLGIGTNSEC
jgi:hypothetical protein